MPRSIPLDTKKAAVAPQRDLPLDIRSKD